MVEVVEAYADTGAVAPSIELFEDVRVVRDGTPIPVQGDGRRALVALLASHAGRIVPVDRILDALWDDEPPLTAPKIIQTYVSQIRRLLEPERQDSWQTLLTRPSGYVLALEQEATDVGAFESAVVAAVHARDGATFADALARWGGEPYAGIGQTFARAEAERLAGLHREARKGWCTERIAAGAPHETLTELEILARDEPNDERVAALRMEALWRAGRRSEALRVFEELRERLADELGLDPGPDVSALHLRMLREELPAPSAPQAAPAVGAAQPPRAPLPVERTELIGREEHVRGLVRLMATEPLVTIVGPGGAGKTRVALRVAHELADAGDAGDVWWVGLAGLADPAAIPLHIARAAGMPLQLDGAPAEALAAWLSARPGMLVLDNCEHIVEPVARLVDELLTRCPRLRVLVTTRVPLHVHGERRWRIPALGLPEGDSLEALAASASGRLLLERAGRAGESFAPDMDDAAHLARVCRSLDGMPLALELAAARLAGMSASALEAGLSARFRLLTAGEVGAPSQHRTLRATTEWSYRLLDSHQRELLDRLSVFVGPAEASAVIAVCADDVVAADDIPMILADLVERSVLEHDRDRYSLLETVREFGRENLGDDAGRWEERHGAWMADVVERVGAGVQGATSEWIRELECHLLDARVAFDRALARRDVELAMQLAGRGNWALLSIGRLPLLRSWVSRSLDAAQGREVPAVLRAEVELMAGALAGLSGFPAEAHRHLGAARERFERAGDASQVLWVDYWTATVLGEQGRFSEAVELGLRAADEARRLDEGAIEANLRAGVAEVALVGALDPSGEDLLLAVADEESVRGLALCRGRRYEEAELRLESNAVLLRALDSSDDAALDECLALPARWRVFGRGPRLAVALSAVASIAFKAGREDVAAALAGETLEVLGFLGWEGPLPGVLRVAAVVGHRDDAEECARLLGAASARWSTYRWRLTPDSTAAEETMRVSLGDERYEALLAEGRARPAVVTVEAAARVLRTAASRDA
ncbi:BTAD domain-containing putative transcriptional regulator [Demequina salsinemoris]|uniref:BTAD domain-containing putative transcriptional regulator n=1 Tax=Demequina salsinemoris TaxID=577470 RepID=UPI000782C990|nr:BTAD domain-containing putative transcriptional regulator [Demequina salsinemoris]